VVIGSRDPNPLVAGKGAAILRTAGVQVEEDFMREECDCLNQVFFHYITKKTPYVVMKYAMTADGKIATKTGASQWITGEEARKHVHGLRHNYMGIMCGIGTVLADDPMLNVRIPEKKSPIRIICDSGLRIPFDSRICQSAGEYRTLIVCGNEDAVDAEKAEQLRGLGIEIMFCPEADGKVDLKELMNRLGAIGIDSILLEGGGELNDSALRAGIVQEVKAYVAPKLFGGSIAKTPVAGCGVDQPEEAVMLELENMTKIGGDLLLEYKVKRTK
jgi:diaminohydroxyphosphoribosylaminopyrimidine deaminase/5-amino-6-(5-phosphoribosylamino)uracil reductase